MKKLYAMILSAVILLACGIIVPQNSAYADSRAPLTGDVYYFTDNPGCYTIQNYLIANSNFTSSTFHLEYRNSPDYTSNAFVANIKNNYNYNLIYDSYVIFECYYEFEPVSQNLNLPYYLEDIFSTLKTHGCEIMFVCATDQKRYYHYTSFLQYVDIHVETDAFYEFLSNAFYYLENVYSTSPLENYNLLFKDMINTQVINFNFHADWFVVNYLRPKLEDDYPALANLTDLQFQTQMNSLDLYFYGYYSGFIYNSFYNTNDTIELDDDDVDYDYIGVFALSDLYPDDTIEWLEDLIDLREENSSNFPIFLYDPYGQGLTSDPSNGIYILEPYSSSISLKEIMLDFITAEDITVYDNWSGVCDITHVMIDAGPDGWILNRGYKSYWQIFPDPIEIED